MRVSVVINNYNYAQFVGRAVDSALEQTHPDIEVIVVDDGSQDDSLRVLQSYQPGITLIAQPNGGQGIMASKARQRDGKGRHVRRGRFHLYRKRTPRATIATACR